MRRIVAKISRRQIMQAFPKASLGVLPMLISFELGFALFAGYFAAHFFAGQKTSERGRIPSLVFDMGDWRVHLHHWLVFLSIFVVAAIASFFVVSPFLFYGFLGGVIVQGLSHYDDWPRIVSRHKKA